MKYKAEDHLEMVGTEVKTLKQKIESLEAENKAVNEEVRRLKTEHSKELSRIGKDMESFKARLDSLTQQSTKVEEKEEKGAELNVDNAAPPKTTTNFTFDKFNAKKFTVS